MAIYSTIWTSNQEFNERVITLDWRHLSLVQFERALLALGRDDVVIVNGALGYPDRWRDMASVVLARAARRGFGIVVSDATWEPRSIPSESSAGRLYWANDRLSRFMARRLLDDRVLFCFLSQREVEQFHIDVGGRGRAVFTPFMTSISSSLVRQLEGAGLTRQPFVFSGGNTLRNWPLLCDALEGCGLTVRVATRHVASWPNNFVVGPCSNDEFFALAATAQLAVLALRQNVVRSCGQQTYLNLLRLATPVVVNDASGVREHIDGVPGAYVTASEPSSMGKQVDWLLRPEHSAEVREAAEAGRAYVIEHFSEGPYLRRLADHAEALASRLAGSG